MVLSFLLVRSNGVSGGKVFLHSTRLVVGGPLYGWGFWFSRDRRSVPLGVRTSTALHDAVNAGVIEGVTLVTTGLTPGVMLFVVANVRQGVKGLVQCSHPSLENQNAHSMPIQCSTNVHCRVITTTVQPVFSLALAWHFGLPFLILFGEFLLRVLMGFSRHGFCTYCVVHVVVHGAFTGSCFVERGSPCLT